MDSKKASYLKLTTAALIWGTVGILRKNVPISSALISFIRAVLGSAVLFIPLLFSKGQVKEKLSKLTLLKLFLCGFLLGTNWILLFESFRYTTVSAATLCYYMEPIILIMLSPIFFKEKLTLKKLLCMLSALLGMVLVSGVLTPEEVSQDSIKGILMALGAALCYALVIIIAKKTPVQDSLLRTRLQLIFAAVTLFPYLILTRDYDMSALTPVSILMLLIMGIVHTGLCYTMFYGAVPKLPAQSVALLSYADPVSALVFSAIFLNEHIAVLGYAGAVLIIGAAIISER